MRSVEAIQQEIERADNWKESYKIGSTLFDQAAGEADKFVIDAYEKAFSLGLNIRTDRERFLTATQRLAKIYFEFCKYEEAINKLLVLDSNVDDLPDWVNLYYASARIQTEQILYWAEVPEILFRRLDGIHEDDPESIRRRTYLYLEFLNRISELSAVKDVSSVKIAPIIAKASELDLLETREYQAFKVAFGLGTQESEEPSGTESDKEDLISVYEQRIEELTKRLEDAESALRSAEEKLHDIEVGSRKEMAESAPMTVQPVLLDILDVSNYLTRRQKILVIGGSETKENHLRGKLKSMGFNFAKDQLEFELDYDNIKDYASRIKPWSGKYAGIIVGPCPHKVKDIEGYTSFIEKIRAEEGYPHVEEARDKSGVLKISNASIGDAVMRMAVYLQSIT